MLPMAKIKVVLSHPRVIFREGIHFILSGEEDFEVAGEAAGYREALELIEANPPDVVILGQDNGEDGAAETIRRIKSIYPSVAVVLVAGKIDTETTFTALTSGVNAILSSGTTPEEMLAVIRDSAQGRLPAVELLRTPALAARTLADFKDLATLNERLGIALAQLSPKETEILNSIAAGRGGEQVTAGLNMTADTLRIGLRIILQKLAANDRVRAVIAQVQKGLPSLIPGIIKAKGGPAEYLTRAEFNEFKDSLTARFKALVG